MLKWSIDDAFDYIQWLKSILNYAPYFIEANDEVNWRGNLTRLYLLITNIGRDNENFLTEEFFSTLLNEEYDFSLPSLTIWRVIGSGNPKSEYKTKYAQVEQSNFYRQRFLQRCSDLIDSEQLFNQIDVSQILISWWGVSSEGLDEAYFHSLMEQNKHPEVFFALQVVRSAAGDYIKIESEKEILSTRKTYELAVRIQDDTEFSSKIRSAAKTYIKRYNWGLNEDNLYKN